MSQKWIVIRVIVWVLVLGWVVYMLRSNEPPPAASIELPPPTPRPVAVGKDPAQVLMSAKAIEQSSCEVKGTLHLKVGAQGLEAASVEPAPADPECIARIVWMQAWPALDAPMDLEWPLGQ